MRSSSSTELASLGIAKLLSIVPAGTPAQRKFLQEPGEHEAERRYGCRIQKNRVEGGREGVEINCFHGHRQQMKSRPGVVTAGRIVPAAQPCGEIGGEGRGENGTE